MTRETIKRLFVVTLCLLVVTGALYSAVLMLVCCNHRHDHSGPGGSCAVCVQLAVSENLLKLMSVALVTTALGLGHFTITPHALRLISFLTNFTGLVCLKTRLND